LLDAHPTILKNFLENSSTTEKQITDKQWLKHTLLGGGNNGQKLLNRVATSLGEKNSRTFQRHSSMFSRPISATFYCDVGILKVIA